MKNRLSSTAGLLLCFTCGCSCLSDRTGVGEPGEVGATTSRSVVGHHDRPVTQERAVQLAQEHLLQLPGGEQYVLKPSRILEQGNSWHVYFKHVNMQCTIC